MNERIARLREHVTEEVGECARDQISVILASAKLITTLRARLGDQDDQDDRCSDLILIDPFSAHATVTFDFAATQSEKTVAKARAHIGSDSPLRRLSGMSPPPLSPLEIAALRKRDPRLDDAALWLPFDDASDDSPPLFSEQCGAALRPVGLAAPRPTVAVSTHH